MLVLLVATGCHSHRSTVTHEDTRYHRAMLDSTVARVDTVCRVDSSTVQLLSQAVVLEWDSLDYRLVLDSAGRVAGITGSRRSSRHSGTAASSRQASRQAVSQAEVSTLTVQSDSVRHELSQVREVETKADVPNPFHWLEWVLIAVLLALAVGGVIYLIELTERWSKRR